MTEIDTQLPGQTGLPKLSRMPELSNYYKGVRKNLDCPEEEKNRIMEVLESNVSEFLSDHPDAGMTEVIRHFGEPHLFGREFLAALDDDELAQKISKKKIFRKWLLVIGIAIVTITVAVCIWIATENSTHVTRHEYDNISDDGIIAES